MIAALIVVKPKLPSCSDPADPRLERAVFDSVELSA